MPPRNFSPAVRAVRTPEALAALRERLSEFPANSRQRGADYYQTGAVAEVASTADHLVTAIVAGTKPYALTWFYARARWTNRCNCPVGIDCTHAYAAGLAWLAAVEAGTRDGRDPAEAARSASRPIAFPASRSPLEPAELLVPAAEVPTDPIEAEIGQWLRALPAPLDPFRPPLAPPQLEATALRVRLDDTGSWWVEIQPAPDKPWKAPSKKWLTDLVALRPADFEHLAPAEAALAAALAAECRLSPFGLPNKRPLPSEAVVGLLRTTAARDALVRPDGSPFAIEAAPLVPEASVVTDEPDRFDVRLVTPDGRSAATAILVTARPEPLYLLNGHVWRGPPPAPSTRLPVAALSDSRLLPRLRAVGLRLPAGHVADVRVVRLRPQLKCWLTPALDGQERDFHAQLTARADDPPCEQHWTDEAAGWRWGRHSAPPPRIAGQPALEFDLAAGHAASARFAGFNLVWDGWAESWTRPVNSAFPDDFIAWHAQLADLLEVDVTKELASLLGAPLRAKVATGIGPTTTALADQDWFDLTVGLKVEDTSLSAEEVALLLKSRGKWVHLPRHGWRRVGGEVDIDPATAASLEKLGLSVDDVLLTGRPVKHQVHALQLVLEAEALAERDSVHVHLLQDRAARLINRPPPEVPPNLRATLRPYQVEGFQFLAHLTANGFGGVLADDMGLGKTVQTLAWLLHLHRQKAAKARRPTPPAESTPNADAAVAATTPAPAPETPAAFRALIVCPKSVMHGWMVETTRFAPDLAISLFDPLARGDAVADTGPRLLVANYTQLRRHVATFRTVPWDAVVLDEGQFIKNPSSQVAVAARSLRARRRVILTGTPIENRLSDLWSLFAFAQPGLLGDHAGFRRQYNEVNPDALARLHRRVQHFLLRRTKAQAAPDLPPRTEDEIVVELEGAQRRLYEAELKRARAELLGVETSRALDAVRFHVLASLLRLRQICCHPGLVDPAHAALPSAKLEALLERIEELAEEGHQVLVFSQFVQMLQIIRTRLAAAGIGHLILTGATENRAELVDTFQTDPTKTVFLLSLKAAGFGLNLTAASYAILYDPWWNPAAEAQAIDRIHRIGQTKPVIAYRLIAQGTVEEKIRHLQHEKAALAAAVVHEESLAQVMDLESLRQILS